MVREVSTPKETGGRKDQSGHAEEFDFSRLKIRPPLAEFEDYARQKVRVAERLGQTEQVEVFLEAFELGKELLAHKAGES